MLTVKHINMIGTETIITAKRVIFYQPNQQAPATPNPHSGGMITIVPPVGDVHEDIGDGTVFVMNDAGKTISRYDLGASPVPLGRTWRPGDDVATAN
jgi:hypothetical protein